MKNDPFKANSVSALLIKFSAPAMAGMLVNALHNIISRVYIGHAMGALGIAGIAIVFPLGLFFMALSVIIGIGSNALFSIYLGKKDTETAKKIFGNAVLSLTIISSLSVFIVWLFVEPILIALGATPEILPYAKDYTLPLLVGYFFANISLGLNNFIRSSGHPKTAMATQIISAVINIITAPIFIFGMHLGMKGASLAVICGQIFSSAWIFAFFLNKNTTYRLELKYLNLDWQIFVSSIKIGFSQFIFQIANTLLNIILNHSLVKYGGNLAVSALGIVIATNTIVIMPVIGLSQGAQPLIGYNYGAKKYKTSIQTLKMAIRWGMVITTIGFIFMQLFSKQVVWIFNSTDKDLIEISSRALRYFNIMLPFVPFQILATSFFQAINKPFKAALLSLSRQVLLLIPAVLILPLFFGLNGVFFATPTADLLSICISMYMLKKYFNKHQQNFFFSKKYKGQKTYIKIGLLALVFYKLLFYNLIK